MPLDKRQLLDFLEVLDKDLSKNVTVVAVGGTAMTLHDAKPSTIDIDFTIPGNDFVEFKRVLGLTPHGFKIDLWTNGMVFSQFLPEDYLHLSKSIPTKMKKMKLKALDPLDIIVTKVGRMNARDKEDIATCIKKFKITKSQIQKRGSQVEYAGNEKVYEMNLNAVLSSFEK